MVQGEALAVVKPGSLIEIWKVLQICIKNDIIIIMQAANTGLTGGSTPYGHDYDRPIIIINNMRVNDIHIIDKGNQIIGFAGSTLYELESELSLLFKGTTLSNRLFMYRCFNCWRDM